MPPKPDVSKDGKMTKQSTLMGFFGKPTPGPRPSSSLPTTKSIPPPSSSLPPPPPKLSAPSTSSPASSTLRTPPSNAGSSPLGPTFKIAPSNGANGRVREGSPLKKSLMRSGSGSEDELSPAPEILEVTKVDVEEKTVVGGDDGDVEMDEMSDGSPFVLSRAAKRKKIQYIESESEDSDTETGVSSSKPKPTASRKPRKSLKEDSDSDEFVIGEDDLALAAAADAYEASVFGSPTPSIASASPAPDIKSKPKTQQAKKFVAPKAVPRSTQSAPTRPPPKPLGNNNNNNNNNSKDSLSMSASNSFLLTESERLKIANKEEKASAENCFDFLLDVKDKNGIRKGEPDYDGRSIYIPKAAWAKFTPFETQFWQIKQDHYDTILFFQKGKFYELYEDDAMKGHQEFDLKLTDRVKMKMVGVPEQQFEIWAAKFLAAGHKVGKVEQVETAIGKEMRTKNDAKSKGPGIVDRQLAQVFTNGTIVDGTYLTSDDANHCVSIKEFAPENPDLPISFGVCVLDASTGQFSLSSFEDDVIRTKLETMFRQIRPKEMIHEKGNLSVTTNRLLRNILPSSVTWQSFKPTTEFYDIPGTLKHLGQIFQTSTDATNSTKPELPEAIVEFIDDVPAMAALGGMLFYLKSLNLDKDLISQKNFNIYDPIREGMSLVLDGQTLAHMEVLVNNEGGEQGTLLNLLQRCHTPFGKRLFRIWLQQPLLSIEDINNRLDAVDDIISHPNFAGDFTTKLRLIPDLERLVSRIHAGSIRESDFLKVMHWYKTVQETIEHLTNTASAFASTSVRGLLRTAPDLSKHIEAINNRFYTDKDEKTLAIMPVVGGDEDCDEADDEVDRIGGELNEVLSNLKKTHRLKEATFWHSNLGNKEIYHIQLPADSKVPPSWSKMAANKKHCRYVTPETAPLIRQMQEAKETQNSAKKSFYKRLLWDFDQDRAVWLKAVQVIAELDCLVSLAKASSTMDEPKCRPTFIHSPKAFIDFKQLRHPSMCLRSEFIDNDVILGQSPSATPGGNGGDGERMVLLTGPNMAGKSTLLRMTAAAVIMAQMGCYVPAASATLSPIDKIQTRMGAYDNMFASASTFKVELDECSKILRQAGPRSLVILDELGRGTSTFDGMAIAGAVLHHLATHTLPLGFFATHYGALTDDFDYHPNIRNMHMQTHVDDRQVIFLYKLIPGIAKSSYGTNVAELAGVPMSIVHRAEEISAEFQDNFKQLQKSKKKAAIPLVAQADFSWLMKVVSGEFGLGEPGAGVGDQLEVVCKAVGGYEVLS